MCGKWRTFEKWRLGPMAGGKTELARAWNSRCGGRTAPMGKVVDKWISGYVESKPNSYRLVDCKEVETLQPDLENYVEAKLHLATSSTRPRIVHRIFSLPISLLN